MRCVKLSALIWHEFGCVWLEVWLIVMYGIGVEHINKFKYTTLRGCRVASLRR
jgi:hypothetical protein